METATLTPKRQKQEQSIMAQVSPVIKVKEENTGEDVPSSQTQTENMLYGCSSYRRQPNELSPHVVPVMAKIERDENAEEASHSNLSAMHLPNSIYQTYPGQYITFTQGSALQLANQGAESMQGLASLGMTAPGAPQPGAAILQYAQSGETAPQFYMPGNKVVVQAATGDMSAYQIRSPTSSLPQGVVMAASPGSMHSPQQMAEEASRKRELRLMKNREAAKQCRRRKREYVRCLETRVSMLEAQNKKLRDELEYLKNTRIYSEMSS